MMAASANERPPANDPRLQQVWQAALSDLQGRLSRANYETWLRATHLVSVQANEATIAAPNAFAVEQLRVKFDRDIRSALSSIVNRPIEVAYVVASGSGGGGTGASTSASAASAGAVTRAPRPSARSRAATAADDAPPPRRGSNAGAGAGSSSRTTGADAAAPRPQPQQMTLEANTRPGLNRTYVFENFVVGTSNQLAHAASLAVADRPAEAFNPLFIHGGVGLGKTHLMHAIGHRAIDQRPDTRVLYVSSERFTNDLILSIRGGRTEEFRERYRSTDILMIDDIQFIAGKEATQEEFFHTFNELFQSGRQIVVSSDKPPKAISTLEDRLRSRFEGGLIVDVATPDVETRTAILSRKGQSLGVQVPSDVIDYVARKVQSNIRELEGALNKIIALAQLYNQPIRMEVAIQALNDTDMHQRRAEMTPDRVIDVILSHFNVTKTDLRGRSRSRSIVIPRQVAMFIMREETGVSLVDIGQALGGRDHTTIMHGIEKVQSAIDTDATLRGHVMAVREALYAAGGNRG